MLSYKKPSSHIISEIKSLLFVIIFAFTVRIFILELFFVPTGSMKQTILEGDYIFSTKYSYGYSKHSIFTIFDSVPFGDDVWHGRFLASDPERGDIIIFRPPHKMNQRFVKRLIGLPGDKIQIINDIVYINDKAINREEIGVGVDELGRNYKKYRETLPNNVSYIAYKTDLYDTLLNHEDNNKIFYVPKDHYFFLGDNRDNSDDSRFNLGFVPFNNFISKGRFVLFSTKELLWIENNSFFENISRIWIWLSSIRIDRIFKNLYNID
jgi:signal peptidase I